MKLKSTRFLSGFSSIFIAPRTYQQVNDFGFATDAEALANDWKKVGSDIRKAMEEECQKKNREGRQ